MAHAYLLPLQLIAWVRLRGTHCCSSWSTGASYLAAVITPMPPNNAVPHTHKPNKPHVLALLLLLWLFCCSRSLPVVPGCCACCACCLQYLCCELAALQAAGQPGQLQVLHVAQVAWRLRTACTAEEAISYHEQVNPELPCMHSL